MSSNKILVVDNFCKSYKQIKAVQSISFEVNSGEIFALLGPNGAGKTSTLECIEGLQRPDSGSIFLMGYVPSLDFKRIQSQVGIQLQTSSLPETITVQEALTISAAYRQLSPRLDLVEKFDLRSVLNRQYASLSTGQQRKLNLAISLAGYPKLLILDEPTAGLDLHTRVELHNIMREEREKGTAILLASHDMQEVEELADQVAILVNGQLIATGSPDLIINSTNDQLEIAIKSNHHSLKGTKFDQIKERIGLEGYQIFLSSSLGQDLECLLLMLKNNNDYLIDLRLNRQSFEQRFLEITQKGQKR